MRELKFRCWDDDNNEMIHQVGIDASGIPYKFPDGLYDTVAADSADYWPDGVVMQYTGLKDKNGVEIYEGDIVTTDYPSVKNIADNWAIEYGHTGMFQMARGSFKESIHDLVYNKWKLEVVGNIYENPELLK